MGSQPKLPWVAYDALLAAWQGEFGGSGPEGYRRFVETDLEQRMEFPFTAAADGWILGSSEFVERVRALISPASREPQVCRARRRFPLVPEQVAAAVCQYYGVTRQQLAHCGSRHVARPVFATLARRHTRATLAELAGWLGVSRRDCVPNLLRRAARDAKLGDDLVSLERQLLGGATDRVG